MKNYYIVSKSVYITLKMAEELQEVARVNEMTESAVIRAYIEKGLENERKDTVD